MNLQIISEAVNYTSLTKVNYLRMFNNYLSVELGTGFQNIIFIIETITRCAGVFIFKPQLLLTRSNKFVLIDYR